MSDVLTTKLRAAMYKNSGSRSFGTARIGGVESVFLRSANAVRAYSVHSNLLPFLSS